MGRQSYGWPANRPAIILVGEHADNRCEGLHQHPPQTQPQSAVGALYVRSGGSAGLVMECPAARWSGN